MPDLEIGFLRNAESVMGYDAFFNFLNYSEDCDFYYSPTERLKLDSYGA